MLHQEPRGTSLWVGTGSLSWGIREQAEEVRSGAGGQAESEEEEGNEPGA